MNRNTGEPEIEFGKLLDEFVLQDDAPHKNGLRDHAMRLDAVRKEKKVDNAAGEVADQVKLGGDFFCAGGREEWVRNLEHHLHYGDDILLLWGEPGAGKSTLFGQLVRTLRADEFTLIFVDARRAATVESLWSALSARLRLPAGIEGWEALKHEAAELADHHQPLVFLVDHADKLQKDAAQLLRAIIDLHLPEVRLMLAADGVGETPEGQWPALETHLFAGAQLARLRPFSEEDARAFLDFALQRAGLDKIALSDKKKESIVQEALRLPGRIQEAVTYLAPLPAPAVSELRLPKASESEQRASRIEKLAQKAEAGAKAKHRPKLAMPKLRVAMPKLSFALPKFSVAGRPPFGLPPRKLTQLAASVAVVAALGGYLAWDGQWIQSGARLVQSLVPSLDQSDAPATLAANLEQVSAALKEEPPASGRANASLPSAADTATSNAAEIGAALPVEDPLVAALMSDTIANAEKRDALKPQLQLPNGSASIASTAPTRESSIGATLNDGATQNGSATPDAKQSASSAKGVQLAAADQKVIKKAAPTTKSTAVDLPPPAFLAVSKPAAAAPKTEKPTQLASLDSKTLNPPASLATKQKLAVTAPKPASTPQKRATAQHSSASRPAAARSGAYTLQIMGLRDLQSAQTFVRNNADVRGLRYHTTTLNGAPWYVIVQGEYPTLQAAQSAAKRLPASLQASKPFPKRLQAL
ncbi:hypothetical protein HDN1F_23370 [gamma proteobacterium HdN1]|nr:hypothetical protein HDN1F_23370 [gamma proteobacterium HdN1]